MCVTLERSTSNLQCFNRQYEDVLYSAAGWVSQIVCNIRPHLISLTCCLPLSQGSLPASSAKIFVDGLTSYTVMSSPSTLCIKDICLHVLSQKCGVAFEDWKSKLQTYIFGVCLSCFIQKMVVNDAMPLEHCVQKRCKRRHRKVLQNENVL